MIKINLLGRKQAAAGGMPFGLDEQFSKLGFNASDFQEARPGLIRLAVLLVGFYLASFLPNYFHQTKLEELNAKNAKLTEQASALTKELNAQKGIRKQMEQLNNEENELQRQLNAVSNLQKDRSLAFRTMDNVIMSLPTKVWLNHVDYKDRTVVLKGASWEFFSIHDFVKSINESIQYTNVIFKGIHAEPPSTYAPGIPEALQKVKNFELEFKVKKSGDS